MHGKTSAIFHAGTGVFTDLPNPFEATRYHSLIVDRATLPDVLEVTAETADGVIMGLRHRELGVEGVQFHPESILTPDGPRLLANFLRRRPARRRADETRRPPGPSAQVRDAWSGVATSSSRRPDSSRR